MKPAIKQLYLRFCVALRSILTHPDCSDRLAQSLTACVVVSRNVYYEPAADKAITPEKAVNFAKAITFGLHNDLEEEDAFTISLPKPTKDFASLVTLFSEFGDVAGQIIEHKDVPNNVSNALHDICVEVTNDANSNPGHLVAWAKYFTPPCLALLAGLDLPHSPEHEQAALETAPASEELHTRPRRPATNIAHPRVTEEQLVEWCDALADDTDEGREECLTGLMVLLWNVVRQETHLDCLDLAERLIDRLYMRTLHCGARKREYLTAFASQMPTAAA